MQVRVRANYDALYDQAGIMVRIDERNWVKAGIEKSDGKCQLSSVLTVDQSDWFCHVSRHLRRGALVEFG
jgi:regulation of enolase protein 1 (concanavalin A-like superfamily)